MVLLEGLKELLMRWCGAALEDMPDSREGMETFEVPSAKISPLEELAVANLRGSPRFSEELNLEDPGQNGKVGNVTRE